MSAPGNRACPCGSGDPLDGCCGRYLWGGADAPTAEALMRARYSAHALGDEAFLTRSWHPDTCPGSVTDPELRWERLDVRRVEGGRALDRTGTVEFVASWRRGTERGTLAERSRFVRLGTRWVYEDGDPLTSPR